MLKDGGHHYCVCSNCRAILLDIFVVRPDEKDPLTNELISWKVKATCPFCGDSSYPLAFKGGFYPGGYGVPKEDDEDEDVVSTKIGEITEENGLWTFRMTKASSDSKPVFNKE